MTTAIKQLDDLRAKALKGGGADRIQKQHDKGKLSARERLDVLLDKGSLLNWICLFNIDQMILVWTKIVSSLMEW